MDALSFGHSQKSKIFASSRKEGAKTHCDMKIIIISKIIESTTPLGGVFLIKTKDFNQEIVSQLSKRGQRI